MTPHPNTNYVLQFAPSNQRSGYPTPPKPRWWHVFGFYIAVFHLCAWVPLSIAGGFLLIGEGMRVPGTALVAAPLIAMVFVMVLGVSQSEK